MELRWGDGGWGDAEGRLVMSGICVYVCAAWAASRLPLNPLEGINIHYKTHSYVQLT